MREEERKRNISLFLHLFMHLLVDTCMCPDWIKPTTFWCMEWCSNQVTWSGLTVGFSFSFFLFWKSFFSYVYWFERETLIGCLHIFPDRGSNLQPRYVPWLEIEPPSFLVCGRCSSQLNHTSKGLTVVLICISLMINDEHLTCSLVICVSSLEKHLFKSFAYF